MEEAKFQRAEKQRGRGGCSEGGMGEREYILNFLQTNLLVTSNMGMTWDGERTADVCCKYRSLYHWGPLDLPE